MIDFNTSDQAEVLVSDFIVRSHLKLANDLLEKNKKSEGVDPESTSKLKPIETKCSICNVRHDNTKPKLLEFPTGLKRKWIRSKVATGEEAARLEPVVEFAQKQQQRQNELEALWLSDPEAYKAKQAEDNELRMQDTDDNSVSEKKEYYESTRKKFYYYAPIEFSSHSSCIRCHQPTINQENPGEWNSQLVDLEKDLKGKSPLETQQLELQRLSLAAPLFVRITLNNSFFSGCSYSKSSNLDLCRHCLCRIVRWHVVDDRSICDR